MNSPQHRPPIASSTRDGALTPVPEERRILAVAGEVRRVGRWLVPRLFRVRALLGEVKIDLRESLIPAGFTLDVRAYGSRVTLIIPPGVNVVFDVFAFMGNAVNQAHEPVAEQGGAPAIRVIGSAYLGEVRVLVRDRLE
jgi:hypothetical protein